MSKVYDKASLTVEFTKTDGKPFRQQVKGIKEEASEQALYTFGEAIGNLTRLPLGRVVLQQSFELQKN